jgi:hypothetical protein
MSLSGLVLPRYRKSGQRKPSKVIRTLNHLLVSSPDCGIYGCLTDYSTKGSSR